MPRDKTVTYEKIIRCMKEEFLAFGYAKASLNRVSAKVGITTAGLYKHFKNKEDLIRKEAEVNKEYADILRTSGKMKKEISDMQWHILATAYVHLIFEVVRHDMTREEAIEHMQFVRDLLYPGWRQIYGL